MRFPEIESGTIAWKATVLPLHQKRSFGLLVNLLIYDAPFGNRTRTLCLENNHATINIKGAT